MCLLHGHAVCAYYMAMHNVAEGLQFGIVSVAITSVAES